MSYKVKLTYFKQSGKYYTNGDYLSSKKHLFEVFAEVQKFLDHRVLPGLCKHHGPFYVMMDVPSHNYNFPHMCIPETWAEPNAVPERATERVCTKEEWKAMNPEVAGSTVSCYVCFPKVRDDRWGVDPEKLCNFHLLLKVYEKIDNIDTHTSSRRPI